MQDLEMNNGGHMKKFDAFWNVTEKKLNELQVTAVHERCHKVSTDENEDVVTNIAISISTKYLYEQCTNSAPSQGVQEEQTLSLLRFRFQFWPKNPYAHLAMNYARC